MALKRKKTVVGRKKNRIVLFSLLGIGAGLFVFRHSIMIAGVDLILRRAIPQKVAALNYEKVEWNNGRVVISGANLNCDSYQVIVDRMEIGCSFDLIHFYLEPHLFLTHPEVTLIGKACAGSNQLAGFGAIVPTKHLGVKLDVQNGVLQLVSDGIDSVQRLYFCFKSAPLKNEIGTFAVSYDPSLLSSPILSIDLEKKEEELSSNIHIQSENCAHLIQFISFFYPEIKEGWENIQGEVEIAGTAVISAPFSLARMHCQAEVRNLSLNNPVLGIQAKAENFHGEFSYPSEASADISEDHLLSQPIWKRIFATAYLQKGEARILNGSRQKEWGFVDAETYLMLDPKKDPSFYLRGGLLNQGKIVPLNLDGRGYVHEDQSFWLEMNMEMARTETDSMKGFFSLCRSEKEAYVLQADFKNLAVDQMKLFQEILAFSHPEIQTFEIIDGEANGKVTAWINHKRMDKICLEDVLANNLKFGMSSRGAIGSLTELKGEGTFEESNGAWTTVHLNAKAEQAAIHIEENKQYDFSGLDMHFVILDKMMQLSWLKGNCLGFDTHIVFNGAGSEIDANMKIRSSYGHLLDLLFKDQQIHANADEIQISTSLKRKHSGLEVVGTVYLGDESQTSDAVQFGCEIQTNSLFDPQTALSFSQGWFRSEKIPSTFYSPILKRLNNAVSWNGDLDLFGTFDSRNLQFSLQANELEAIHPKLHFQVGMIGEKDPLLLKTDGRATFSYDFNKGNWNGFVPIHRARIKETSTGLVCEHVEASVSIEENQVKIGDLSLESEGLNVNGQIDFKHIESNMQEMRFTTSRISGSADSIMKLLNRFGLSETAFPITGEVFSGDRECWMFARFSPTGNTVDWQLKGGLRQAAFALNAQSKIENLKCDIALNSKQNILAFSNLSGDLCLQNKERYRIGANDLQWNKECVFDLNVSDAKQEVARIAGSISKTAPSQLDVHFNSDLTHFYGTKLNVSQMCVKDLSKISLFTFNPSIKMDSFLSQMEFLSSSGLLSCDRMAIEALRKLEFAGAVELRADYNGDLDQLDVQASALNLVLHGKPLDFDLAVEKRGDRWNIQKMHVDQFSLKTVFESKAAGLNVPMFELTSEQLSVKGNGLFHYDQKQFDGNVQFAKLDLAKAREWTGFKDASKFRGTVKSQGQFKVHFFKDEQPWSAEGALSLFVDSFGPGILQMQNEGTFSFSYSGKSGLRVKDINVQALGKFSDKFSGTCAVDEILVHPEEKNGFIKGVHFSLTPAMLRGLAESGVLPSWTKSFKWEGPVEGGADVQFTNGNIKAQASLKDGYYWIGESVWDMEHIALNYEAKALKLSCKTSHQRNPLFVNLHIDIENEPKGILSIQEAPKQPGLKLAFKSEPKQGLICESLQGNLFGLDMNFIRNGNIHLDNLTVLSGNVKIDIGKLSPLMSKEMQEKLASVKIGKGYELAGNILVGKEGLNDLQFSGKLKGENFDLMGYRFQSMEAQVEMNPHHAMIHNLNIQDEAGFLTVKQIKLDKNEVEDAWRCDIPLLQIEDLRPSILRKTGEQQKNIKPLVIKHLSLTNVKGSLKDLSTFTGRGHLNFTNAFKKDHSVFALPIEMIKNIGLDPGLFTPVYGEIDTILENGKFYLTQMRNTYSEGKRSYFYLASDHVPCFVDLNGKVSVDIKMKQDVMLNVTEPFVLTIRGTMEKPKYGFQK
ncbi:MAG TPA: hypothetical protein VLG49_05215 [Rhabdochlamydiaceae bacterium]|nr:hypothetical protein [Rhabdochlamydiaceae bacterium]